MEEKELPIEATLELGSKQKRPVWKLSLFILAVIAVAAGGALWLLFGGDDQKTVYREAAVERGTLRVTVSATGNLEPTNTVDVGIEVSGTIEAVYADYNDAVKVGDVLARLDTTKLESQMKNAKAALAVARADLTKGEVALNDAKNEYDRAESMFKATAGNYPSDKERDAARTLYDTAKAAYEGAKAKVLQARASLDEDVENLEKAVVKSPLNGIILDRNVEVGQTVAASLQTPVLFTIAEDLAQMEVVASVDEADIGQVKEGQKVTFTVDAYPMRTFEGQISQVRLNSQIVDGVVTYETVIVVDNSELLLRPGMTATADIETQVFEDVLSVPNAALRFSPENKNKTGKKGAKTERLWVLRNGVPAAINIKSGESDGSRTIILQGVHEGDRIVVGKTKVAE